jgi:acetyl esterase
LSLERLEVAMEPKSSVRSKPVLEPTTQKLMDAIAASGGRPLYELDPPSAREVLRALQNVPVPKAPATIEDTTFPVGPTGATRVRILRPDEVTGALPVVMWFHGGGWVLGDKETHDRLVREIVHGTRAAVVFVDYDRSPEAHFPVAIEQAYAATKYVADHGKELGLDPARIAIAGDSVGGNMVAVVAILAKERKGPKLAIQVMYYPVTDASFSEASYATFEDGPWLAKPGMAWFWDSYLPDRNARRQVMASPLNATVEQLRDLPPALVVVDENDILRDEGEAYARKLIQAGVRVTTTRYNGTIHDFVMLNPLAETPAVRAAISQGIDALRAALG